MTRYELARTGCIEQFARDGLLMDLRDIMQAPSIAEGLVIAG
jgi:hypothetical protein